MGVPALFRWLSKKYPKIVYSVVEDEETNVLDEDGQNVVIPINITHPNPNGTEFDNLYLDMNGIVHPCTHPEGKPAPETEAEMMVEIFKYTERIVNMIRPRKLLFMAIDGVAPRAKMNQQRSRRFRSAQEAKEKEEARKESVAMWEAMGKKLSEEEKNKESWDSNAITPGTPFMDLLATSLRYWVVQKINMDPGWKQIQVIISDAGVPGEGEHKIMDFIRRQRTNRGHDPNTRHVIYGLDADLIMLSLATHEPHFKVLREDVFFKDASPNACRVCGQEGHYAAQCTGLPSEITNSKQSTGGKPKPFIFLDVAILREYLEVELNVSYAPFPFVLEQAIDDWVLLIFFVGNDFLPHLPSLEIREGAIDTLLRIWKQELPRMGGYLTNHGQIELQRAQIILEGLAKREDEIFRRRREGEERHDQHNKRQKIEAEIRKATLTGRPSPLIQLTSPPTAPPVHPSLPQRPVYNFAANADSIGFGVAPTVQSLQNTPTAAQALAGSNRDVVANRRAIRMANMSAAEMLKAEMGGIKPDLSLPPKPVAVEVLPTIGVEATRMSIDAGMEHADDEVPGLGMRDITQPAASNEPVVTGVTPALGEDDADIDVDADGETEPDVSNGAVDVVVAGVKRKHEDDEDEDSLGSDDEAPPDTGPIALKVNKDGTVEQEDKVKLWEPGYKDRYYRQKFDVAPDDAEFKKQLTKSYVEGLCWVLHYYYQGTPSWQWYYPYHFAPFAADFVEVSKMDIKFEIGQPFKPFEQLMGVFPAASRKHIPEVFQPLMIREDSPIIDFYPLNFEIDMNGKKMAWQGVALLPFINEKRLLDAMATEYPKLGEDEMRRNRWGNNVIFASDEHPLYPFYETLYGKKKKQEPVPIDPKLSKGLNGSVLPNPDCLPGSTYESPLPLQDQPDIKNDRSLSVLYYFPKQLSPHRSVLLPGVKRGPRILTSEDLEATRGGRGRGRLERGRGNGGPYRGGAGYQNSSSYNSNSYNGSNSYDRGYSGRGSNLSHFYSSQPSRPPPYQSQQGYGGYGGGGRGPSTYNGPNQYGSSRGGPPTRGTPPQSYSYGTSYGQGQVSYGSGSANPRGSGGYGGYGQSEGHNGYGGYGRYGGGGHNLNNAYGYNNAGMAGGAPYNAPPRGRGRGW